MRRAIKYIGYGLTGALLLSGCMPRIPAPPVEQNQTVHRVMWEDTSTVEKNYALKPEPYSLDSKQKDPELLGPQSTLKKSLAGREMDETPQAEASQNASDSEGQYLAKDEEAAPATARPAMTRSRCIELIGRSDFDKYTRQFGSEEAALRKCIILERVQKR